MNQNEMENQASGVGPLRNYPLHKNLYELFAQQASVTPDAIAIVADTSLTYRELSDRTDRVAACLQRQSIRTEQAIGVFMHRSGDMVATLLGIMKAGGAYVPLDPDDPPLRNQRIFTVAGCTTVIVSQALEGQLIAPNECSENSGAEALFLIAEQLMEDERPAGNVNCAPGGSNLAYILFTSGSSGEPKGVEVEHHSVINLLFAARDVIDFTSSDRFLASSTIGFDISVAEIFLPLITGGSLLLRDRRILLEPRKLASEIVLHGVSVVQTGPSVWSLILSEVPAFPRVRVAITTSEAVGPGLAHRLLKIADQVWNLYGPTEATVWAASFRLTQDTVEQSMRQSGTIPIGQAIANTELVIIDAGQVVSEDHATGELCIGGEGVARAYCRDDALSLKKFIELGSPPCRFYRTGDLAAWQDRQVLYLGRMDEQLKIRGIRIEPGEIEAAINAHPGVRDSAVTWYGSVESSCSIVAAVVGGQIESITPDELRSWLAMRLPTQYHPSRFIFFTELPLTGSGKVDRLAIRNALTEFSGEPPEQADGRVLTDTERLLSDIWQRLLRRGPVAATEHFFSIGGDSLAAVMMLSDVETAFKVSIGVQAVFESPTLEQLAARIDQLMEDNTLFRNPSFIFPLSTEREGRAIFFNNVNLNMATRGKWTVPCPLFSISHWAQGTGFCKADSIHELVEIQIAALRAIQPLGPYRLAGYSYGCLMALDMAHQLEKQGERIELLFLLDPMQPHFIARVAQDVAENEPIRKRLQRHFNAVPKAPGRFVKYIAERLFGHVRASWLQQWLIYKIVHLHGKRPSPISTLLLPKNRWPAFWYSANRLARTYDAQPYNGKVLGVFSRRDARFEAWRELIGSDQNFHILESAHLDLFSGDRLKKWQFILSAELENCTSREPVKMESSE